MFANRAEFEALVAGAGEQLVVFDFTAAWCGPCQKIKPIFERFADEFPKVLFVKIDTDMNSETAKACQVAVMPTFQFYKNGRLIHTIKGADPQALHDAIKEYGGDKWDSLPGGQTLSGAPATASSEATVDARSAAAAAAERRAAAAAAAVKRMASGQQAQ